MDKEKIAHKAIGDDYYDMFIDYCRNGDVDTMYFLIGVIIGALGGETTFEEAKMILHKLG